MSLIIALSRIILPILTIFIIVKCLISLLFGRPRQNIIAHLRDTITGETYELNMWESSIGRAKACDIVFNDSSTSRFHAVIARRVNGWYIFDLLSKNGVRVNGKTIENRNVIENGDIISIGANSNLQFIVDNDPIIRVSKQKLKQMQKEAARRMEQSGSFAPDPQYSVPQAQYVPSDRGALNVGSPALISQDGTITHLQGYNVSIGRDELCEIRIFDSQAEFRHASIDLYEDGSWVISNLSRKGTTFLNGVRVTEPYILIEGDKIRVSGSQFTYTEKA